MAINLEKSKRFQEDINMLKEKISKITKEDLKTELEGYLKVIISEVRNLDIMHEELTMHRELSNGVHDSRGKIAEIRRKLDKKLDSWERANS